MLDREVAGITCREVLARLERYLAGELAQEERTSIEAHLGGCDRCTRFGGAYADVCRRLREELGRPTPIGAGVRDRLRRRLSRHRPQLDVDVEPFAANPEVDVRVCRRAGGD